MLALYWNGAIALSIVASFAIAWKLTRNAFIRNCVRFSVPVFWLLWTLGLSQYVVGITLTGKLFLFQTALILAVSGACWLFFRSLQKSESGNKILKEENKKLEKENERKNRLIIQLEADLQRIANERLTKDIDRIRKGQIDVLRTPHSHRRKLKESLETAEHTLVILSGWVTRNSLNYDLKKLFIECLERGVQIYIGYGWQSLREDPQQKRKDKEAVQALNNLRGWIEKKIGAFCLTSTYLILPITQRF